LLGNSRLRRRVGLKLLAALLNRGMAWATNSVCAEISANRARSQCAAQ
jgi:hypothetical protein